MTLDEAIKHCEEVARGCECEARQCDEFDGYESHVRAECLNCAADHRQLAEWLEELKERRNTSLIALFGGEICEVRIMEKAKKGKWEDVHNTYIEETDGYFSQAKCSICKQYSAQYSKYGIHFWLEYCSHCGAEMSTKG